MPQIQYMPGPFSFLATLGEAGGAAFQSAENQRRVRQSEAYNVANLIMKGVESGYLPRSALSSKEVSSVFGHLFAGQEGAPPVSPGFVPNPQENIARQQTEYLEGFEGPEPVGLTDQQRGHREAARRQVLSTGRIPTLVEEGTEAAKAEAIQGGGAAGRVVTGTVREDIAAAGESAALSAGIAPEAARIVDEVVAGQDVTEKNFAQFVDAAAKKYTETMGQNAPLTPDAAKRYFADALQKMRFAQMELANRRLAAMQSGFTSQDPQYLRILQAQQAAFTNLLNALPEPSENDRRIAAVYQNKLGQQKTPEEVNRFNASPGAAVMKESYDRVQAYDELKQSLVSAGIGVGSAVTRRLSEDRLPGQEPGVPSAQPQAGWNVEGMANSIVSGEANINQLKALLQSGDITQDTYNRVINLVVEKRSTK